MFEAYYDIERFKFIHQDMIASGLIGTYENKTLIKKTACLYSERINVYIDTSDGVNEDLEIDEYCGRIKRVIIDSKGKPFLFFKSAYSKIWSRKICEMANLNNGKVIPFFKWSFNKDFYNNVYGKKEEIISQYHNQEKKYDIGIFFSDKQYEYPKPSELDPLISWPDHKNFNLPGNSKDTGSYLINSRKNIVNTLKSKNFKVLHASMNYLEYIRASFQCKVIINPPGIGEYTSRMVDQTYLGNCIVLRKNSYDNAKTWKNLIPELDFSKTGWEDDLHDIIDNVELHQRLSKEYFENFWNSRIIVDFLLGEIKSNLLKL